jgi:hypothetical protein
MILLHSVRADHVVHCLHAAVFFSNLMYDGKMSFMVKKKKTPEQKKRRELLRELLILPAYGSNVLT